MWRDVERYRFKMHGECGEKAKKGKNGFRNMYLIFDAF